LIGVLKKYDGWLTRPSAVRKVIFDWSLKLEQAGIRGDGVSFDELTKRKAKEAAVVNSIGKVENFYGVAGNASGAGSSINVTQTINQNDLNLTDARSLAVQIGEALQKLKVDPSEREHMRRELVVLDQELETASPDQSKIRRGFKSILETVGGGAKDAAKDILAAGIAAAIKGLLRLP
jgi:hypothetical protein